MAKPDTAGQVKRQAFLASYAKTGNVSLSCEVSGLSRSRHYELLQENPEYRQAVQHAQAAAADVLEAEARRRAIEGVTEPVGWHQGTPGGYVQKYSDTLLIFLLKGARPEKYKDRIEARIGPLGKLQSMDDQQLAELEVLPDTELIERLGDGRS